MNKKILALALASMMLLSACSTTETATEVADDAAQTEQTTTEAVEESTEAEQAEVEVEEPEAEPEEEAEPEADPLRIAGLKGATTMGISMLEGDYELSMYTAADEIVPLLVKGEIDIALVPSNLAATLYQTTNQSISVININTTNVLTCVASAEADIDDVADLAGKTVYMTGKGTTPEAAMRSLISMSGTEDITLEFKSESAEVVAALATDPTAIAVLPQPFATVATMQNEGFAVQFTLEDSWGTYATDGSQIVTGVTIVSNAVLAERADDIDQYLLDAAASVALVNSADEAGLAIEALDIVAATVAQQAIPYCGISSITGDEMYTALSGYLTALYNFDADMIGGAMPDEGFYYLP